MGQLDTMDINDTVNTFYLSRFFSFISHQHRNLYNPILISCLRSSRISYHVHFRQITPIFMPPSPTFCNWLSGAPSLLARAQSPLASPISRVSATASPRSPNTYPSSALSRFNP